MPDDVKTIIRKHWNRTFRPEGGMRAPIFRLALAAVAMALASIVAGTMVAAQTAGPATDHPRFVIDMRGREIRLPERITRAVGTGGAVDEWFLLLGSPEKLVATSPMIQSNPWYARIYPRIREIDAPISSGDVNIEILLARQAEVAIMLSGMSTIDKIERSGIPTVVLERRDARELKQAITIAGKVLGPKEEEAAARFCIYYDANIARVTERTAPLPPERRVRVYYAGNGALTTEGADSMVTSWIETAGGTNVAARPGIEGMGATVSMEDIVAWDPQVIIAMRPAVRDEIMASERWKGVSAVREGRVYVNPKGVYSWGVRSAEEAIQVLWAGKTLHPELFGDIDMIAETKRFHRMFYHFDMTDDDASRVLQAEPPG